MQLTYDTVTLTYVTRDRGSQGKKSHVQSDHRAKINFPALPSPSLRLFELSLRGIHHQYYRYCPAQKGSACLPHPWLGNLLS